MMRESKILALMCVNMNLEADMFVGGDEGAAALSFLVHKGFTDKDTGITKLGRECAEALFETVKEYADPGRMIKQRMHHDQIVAWAKGAAIEEKNSDGWWRESPGNLPTWADDVEYRVQTRGESRVIHHLHCGTRLVVVRCALSGKFKSVHPEE